MIANYFRAETFDLRGLLNDNIVIYGYKEATEGSVPAVT